MSLSLFPFIHILHGQWTEVPHVLASVLAVQARPPTIPEAVRQKRERGGKRRKLVSAAEPWTCVVAALYMQSYIDKCIRQVEVIACVTDFDWPAMWAATCYRKRITYIDKCIRQVEVTACVTDFDWPATWAATCYRKRITYIDKCIRQVEVIACVTDFDWPATWAATCYRKRIIAILCVWGGGGGVLLKVLYKELIAEARPHTTVRRVIVTMETCK